jgi:hypothetical protein
MIELWMSRYASVRVLARIAVAAVTADDALLWSAPLLSKHRSNRVKAGAECTPVSALTPAAAGG